MKILVFLWTYPPYRYVGGELATAKILEYLAGQDHEVMVYAKQIPQSYSRNGIPIAKSAYLREDIAQQYDVFITHPEIRTSVIREVRGLPYVAIVHNVAGRTLRSLERHPPTLTIANSEYTYNHFPIAVRETRVGAHIIHPPVVIEPKAGEHKHITMVNLSLEKGGSVLNYVANKNPDLSFLGVLGGHGHQVDNQPSNVHIIAQTKDMQDVYADTRLLIFPTHDETYGMVAAEALVNGIPVIASDLPAVREVCGDAAIYLDPYDYDAWDTEVKRMSEAKHYAKWKAMAEARGTELLNRSTSDLQKFEVLLREAAGK